MIWWLSTLSLLNQTGLINWLWRVSISEKKALNHNCFMKKQTSKLGFCVSFSSRDIERIWKTIFKWLNYFCEAPNKASLARFSQAVASQWSRRLSVVSQVFLSVSETRLHLNSKSIHTLVFELSQEWIHWKPVFSIHSSEIKKKKKKVSVILWSPGNRYNFNLREISQAGLHMTHCMIWAWLLCSLNHVRFNSLLSEGFLLPPLLSFW